MTDRTRAERGTGYVLGGISPLGRRAQRPTVVDESGARVGSDFPQRVPAGL